MRPERRSGWPYGRWAGIGARHIEAQVPAELDIHLVIDNYAPHKHEKVRLWLGQRPRFHVHYTPTYASWLNQVEGWFDLITRQAIRRGSFKSPKQLIAKIEQFVAAYNPQAKPFAWVATTDSIFEKLRRLCQRISGTLANAARAAKLRPE